MAAQPVSFTPVRPSPTRSNSLRERLAAMLPQFVLMPSLLAPFVYVFVFSGWTIWISLSNSALLPDYSLVGFHHYAELWSNRRWSIAYNNLFLFSSLYVVGAMAIGLTLDVLTDQRVRVQALWGTMNLSPLAVPFIFPGTLGG